MAKNRDVGAIAECGGAQAPVSIRLDRARFVVEVDNVPVQTTRLEFDLLDYLVQNADRVVSKPELFEFVIRSAPIADSGLIRVHVAHLRRKLGSASRALRTVRGRGLMWDRLRLAAAPAPRPAKSEVLRTTRRRQKLEPSDDW